MHRKRLAAAVLLAAALTGALCPAAAPHDVSSVRYRTSMRHPAED
ncbi:hypothetical protein F750_0896 [Streptomyces sp. PAMC 26508]|nr:hypothetical protein F750_0896 [Streptomyces sp. PAMC 26508]